MVPHVNPQDWWLLGDLNHVIKARQKMRKCIKTQQVSYITSCITILFPNTFLHCNISFKTSVFHDSRVHLSSVYCMS